MGREGEGNSGHTKLRQLKEYYRELDGVHTHDDSYEPYLYGPQR